MRPPRGFVIGMAVYVALTVGGSLLLAATEPPEWVRAVAPILPSLAAVVAIVSIVRAAQTREGIERTSLYENASLAFFVTALSALSYGFFEVWAHAPKLSGFVVWSVAMGSWLVIALVRNRRYR